jgi:hypothetical protein
MESIALASRASAVAQSSEHTIRLDAESFPQTLHTARPHQVHTATASVLCAMHFINDKMPKFEEKMNSSF